MIRKSTVVAGVVIICSGLAAHARQGSNGELVNPLAMF
jgi:hypothetical protein